MYMKVNENLTQQIPWLHGQRNNLTVDNHCFQVWSCHRMTYEQRGGRRKGEMGGGDKRRNGDSDEGGVRVSERL